VRRLTGLVAASLVVAVWSAPAGASSNDGNQAVGGGAVVNGTPVAIAVQGPSGTIGSYERKGRGRGSRWTCAYYGFENGSTSGMSLNVDHSSGPIQPVQDQAYAFICRDQDGQVVHTRYGLYDAGDPFAGLFAAERAAELALERLGLPDPLVGRNPPGDQLVGLPSWLWVDTPWAPSDVSASVSGVTSTVTATPTHVVWDTGDGASITCHGPGAPFDSSRSADAQSSDCTHLYIWPSSSRPGGVYEVTATTTYVVGWVATNGQTGDLGTVTRSSTVPVRVVEAQAVINGG
jgi:hypothetical protein